jgi:predicted nucleotidyltransferase
LLVAARDRYGAGVRRYAILDDNQQRLERRLAEVRDVIRGPAATRVCAARVIGSVARGCARDESDVDVVLVLRSGAPRRADYTWWDEEIAPRLARDRRFPVQPLFIARASVATAEPNLRSALDEGVTVWDPEGIFDDEPEARP